MILLSILYANLPHPISSLASPQSSLWSQANDALMHLPFEHLNWLVLQSLYSENELHIDRCSSEWSNGPQSLIPLHNWNKILEKSEYSTAKKRMSWKESSCNLENVQAKSRMSTTETKRRITYCILAVFIYFIRIITTIIIAIANEFTWDAHWITTFEFKRTACTAIRLK